jgi:hypothetical protein
MFTGVDSQHYCDLPHFFWSGVCWPLPYFSQWSFLFAMWRIPAPIDGGYRGFGGYIDVPLHPDAEWA